MIELIFPIAATLALMLIAIPMATLLCKLALVATRPQPTDAGVREAGSNARYLLLVAPVGVPVVWLISAVAHHAEAEQAALTCLFDHLSHASCAEPLVIAVVVTLMLGATFVWRRRLATRAVSARGITYDPRVNDKLEHVYAEQPGLQPLRDRIRVIEGDEIRTVGLLRRHIEVSASLARTLETRGLAGALLHEVEHVRSFDPLRFLVLSVVQTLNPASRLLDDEVRRWRAGREAVCDEAAVHHGAEPMSLAQALLAAARPRVEDNTCAAHLGRGGGIALLRVRVTLLMEYLTSPPRCRCPRTATKFAVIALTLFAALPHVWGDDLIVDLHQGAERIAVETLSE